MITAFNPKIKYHDKVYSSSHSFLFYEFSHRERSAQESRRSCSLNPCEEIDHCGTKYGLWQALYTILRSPAPSV